MIPKKLTKLIILIAITITASIMSAQTQNTIKLPAPRLDSEFSIEGTLLERRSVREYSKDALTLEQLSQLLWACQGINLPDKRTHTEKLHEYGLRTAPSAGALYPLEVFVIVKNVTGLPPGSYHYHSGPGIEDNNLELLRDGNLTQELAGAALGQDCIKNAAVNIIIGAVVERVGVKYGSRAEQYTWIETGHAGQNICLQAQALGLGVTTVGAFYEDKIKKVIGTEINPVYLITVGKKLPK
ncbi:MAG: SagB/ThcOx family dehydrogenase [Candidatus Hatepunaea meridiana]|nr:SagB/ThcOx family dehydrogenase [Candidatus Hatepunaea meridiana]